MGLTETGFPVYAAENRNYFPVAAVITDNSGRTKDQVGVHAFVNNTHLGGIFCSYGSASRAGCRQTACVADTRPFNICCALQEPCCVS